VEVSVQPEAQPEAKPALPAGPLLAQAPRETRGSTPLSSPVEFETHGNAVVEQASHDVDLAMKQRIRRAAMADSSL